MRRLVATITLGVYIVTTIPYIFGYAVAGPDSHFTGIVFDVSDTAQYFAWMRSFSDQVVIANPLTPEPGANRFFNLQWWLLGLLAFKTPLGTVIVYQLLRIAALAGFAVALAWFCQRVSPRNAELSFVLIMLASGFGWMLVALKYLGVTAEVRFPLDVYIGEANTFFSAMAFPHLLVAAALLLTIFVLFLGATGPRRWTYSAALVVITLILGFSHGYDLIPAFAIPAVTAGILSLRERRISEYAWPAAAILVGGIPPGLYVLALTRLDSTWEGVLDQYGNAGVFSPSPPHLVILLGLPLLLALPQLHPRRWKAASVNGLFVRVWAVVGFFLLYIPTDYQVKMLIAYQVPIGILAASTITEYVSTWDRSRLIVAMPRVRTAVVIGLVAFVALTNVYLTGWRVVDLRRQDYPYYLAREDVQALEQLDTIASDGDIVLASPHIGLFVPVYSDARPYVAHWAQTLHFYQRRDLTRWFYSQEITAGERNSVLVSQHIAYVIAGPAEVAFVDGRSLPPFQLEPLYGSSTMLYSVPKDSSRAP